VVGRSGGRFLGVTLFFVTVQSIAVLSIAEVLEEMVHHGFGCSCEQQCVFPQSVLAQILMPRFSSWHLQWLLAKATYCEMTGKELYIDICPSIPFSLGRSGELRERVFNLAEQKSNGVCVTTFPLLLCCPFSLWCAVY
jgi:hypothetical protein